VLPPEIAASGQIRRALGVLRARWPVPDSADDDSPIFVLSAGWGSGSTLLQRLIMSDRDTLLWGEPFDHAVPLFRLAQMIVPVSDRWPRDAYFESPSSSKPLQDRWVANLTPPVDQLRNAQREFVRTWLARPASDAGRSRWGLKEVRLTADHARHLKWLFPRARFVFLYRDVLKSWASCRHVKWHSVWPGYRVDRPSAFGHHWRHLVEGFLDAQQELDATLISYEDLVHGKVDFKALANRLGTGALDTAVLDVKLGARSAKRSSPTRNETAILMGITSALREKLGYA
jgi:Sulfotransferase family